MNARHLGALLLVLAGLPIGEKLACADGGSVCAVGEAGPYRVTIFSLPTPLRAGQVDFSVLVQDAASGSVNNHAKILFRAWPAGRPVKLIQQQATQRAAVNKLLKAALLEIPYPGRWHVAVILRDARGTWQLAFPAQVAPAMPRWADMILWIILPIVAIVLFSIREVALLSSTATRTRPRQAPRRSGVI